MKIKSLLILSISFFSIQLSGTPLDSIQDTVPFENPEYIGYRIALTNLSAEAGKKSDLLKIEFTAINTGRKDLLFGKKIAPPPQLVVHFDQSIQNNKLIKYAKEIREALLKIDFHVAAGKISKRVAIKVPSKQQEMLVKSQATTTTESLENPRLVKSKTKEVFTAKAPPVDDFESSLAGSRSRQYDKNACSDLIFESVKVVKKSKNKVTLEYTILNQGAGPATLITNRKKENKNMAVQAYMSSKERVTKSSFSFDGDFIGKGLNQSNGKLYPGERYTNTIKLNIQKMTKFTPYVILELDPYLSVYECDKKNNKLGVKVGEGIGN